MLSAPLVDGSDWTPGVCALDAVCADLVVAEAGGPALGDVVPVETVIMIGGGGEGSSVRFSAVEATDINAVGGEAPGLPEYPGDGDVELMFSDMERNSRTAMSKPMHPRVFGDLTKIVRNEPTSLSGLQ